MKIDATNIETIRNTYDRGNYYYTKNYPKGNTQINKTNGNALSLIDIIKTHKYSIFGISIAAGGIPNVSHHSQVVGSVGEILLRRRKNDGQHCAPSNKTQEINPFKMNRRNKNENS